MFKNIMNVKSPPRVMGKRRFLATIFHNGNQRGKPSLFKPEGGTLSPQFTLSVADFPISIWSSFDMEGLSLSHRIQRSLRTFGLSKHCYIMPNPFTDYRLKEWIKRNSQCYSLGSMFSIKSDIISPKELEISCSPHNAIAPLAEGVYSFFLNENYIELDQQEKYIIFDTKNKNWNKENIRDFILNFSGELKNYTWHKIPNPTAYDSLVLPDEILEDLKGDLGSFLQSQELYKTDLELPWRRGIMLYGSAGNGKTMCIRKTCEYFGLEHIDVDKLIGQDGSLQLEGAVRERDTIDGELFPEDQRPVVCILEDIDKYTSFQSGETEKDVGKISLHALLKGLDGVDEVSGIILFATTNFPDLLHEAIAGRPGRFDKIYEIKKPTLEGIIKLLAYHKISIVDGNLDQIAKELNGSSMAFVAEFIKSAKMKYKRNDLKTEEARVLLDAIHRHQALCRKHFQEDKSVGFSR